MNKRLRTQSQKLNKSSGKMKNCLKERRKAKMNAKEDKRFKGSY